MSFRKWTVGAAVVLSMVGTLAVQGAANADIPCGFTNRVVPEGTVLYNTFGIPVGVLPGGALIADGPQNGNLVFDDNTGGYVPLDRLARVTDATCVG